MILDTIKRTVRALLPPPTVPSILEQTQFDVGFYKFHDEGRGMGQNVEYFNCGLVPWRGRLNLVTRRRIERQTLPGHNSLWIFPLENNVPSGGREIRIRAQFYREHWEDPRAIQAGNQILVSYTNFRQRSFAHQAFGVMTPHFTIPRPMHPKYGKNGKHIHANTGWEKNWLYFFHNRKLFMVYTTDPHVVCEMSGDRVIKEYATPGVADLWKYGSHAEGGLMRCGTPPIRVGNEYFSIFHSSDDINRSIPRDKLKLPRRRYYMGAYAFSAEPPFKITRLSEKPILTASENDPRNLGAPYCVFPCGSHLADGQWLITFGVNDCKCAWIKIPHDALLRGMI